MKKLITLQRFLTISSKHFGFLNRPEIRAALLLPMALSRQTRGHHVTDNLSPILSADELGWFDLVQVPSSNTDSLI
ncbi:hypothetical protein [Oceanisphaera sp. IT1-181]|uniref:hypothetical protein n=1 Tax=Oceanisphaera sp. IT1-181 TaxID=3081199 RepID=UPI0029CA32B1|nr:hypothetical protein [Oceanisphaera sp. IT1-181]